MRKNIVVAMGAACLFAFLLGGCGNSAGTENADPTTQQETSGQEDTDAGSEDGQEQEGETDDMESAEVKEVPILRDAVEEDMGIRIGAEVTLSESQDEKVWEIVTTHFNALTIGNELKPDALFNYSNSFCSGTEEAEIDGETILVPKLNYSRAEAILDKVLEWNQENPDKEIKMRGHVLVWHSQTPEWFFHEDYDRTKDYVDKDTMNRRLEWYIRTVLTHFTGEDSKYKDLFYGWDVVNEAISDSTGSYRSDNENPAEPLSQDTHGSNSSWWHVYESNEYILNAFLYANKYAPADLELYYNDYNECTYGKQKGIIQLLQDVKELEGAPGEGTRIDGMGMQGHYSLGSPDAINFENAINAYAAVVGNVQITEFDVRAGNGYDGSDEAKEKEYKRQAGYYNQLYEAVKKADAEEGVNVTGITFWGTVDHYSWLQSRSNVGGGKTDNLPECPLLFDENYEPKPAFYVFAGEYE